MVDGKVYVWGGDTRPAEDAATINCFQPLWESWSQSDCIGPTPSGLYYAACASAGHHFYVYGGHDESRYYSSLHQLDLRTNTWRMISSDHDGPKKKIGCGLIFYNSSSNLLLFGGEGEGGNITDEIRNFNLKEGEEEGAMSY